MSPEAPLQVRIQPSLTSTEDLRGARQVVEYEAPTPQFQSLSLKGLGSILAQRLLSGAEQGLERCLGFLKTEVGDSAGFNKYDREVMLWAAACSLIQTSVGSRVSAVATEDAAGAWQVALRLVAELGRGDCALVADPHRAVATAFEQAQCEGIDLTRMHAVAEKLPGDFRQLYLCALVQRTATPKLPAPYFA